MLSVPEQHALIEDHLYIVPYMVRWYRSKMFWLNYELLRDLHSAGNLGLVLAANRFNPEKGASFKTWAYIWVRKEMVGVFKALKRNLHFFQERLDKFDDANREWIQEHLVYFDEALEREFDKEALRHAIQSIPVPERRVMELRANGFTDEEIGKKLGFTKQRSQQIRVIAERRLKHQLMKSFA